MEKNAYVAPLAGPADTAYEVPRAERPMTFTGERMTADCDGQIAFEHFHRYSLARDLVIGRDVLDVASGEGYGSALMASVARSVVGVEIDAASVDHARLAYPRANLHYLQGDATRMPLRDACVDVVVSFETLEHLRDHEGFLREVRRVLRPGGLFLVSTPDRDVYSAPGQPKNPYHVRELTQLEFAALLGAHFGHHRILAQRALIGSVFAPLAAGDGAWRTYDSHPDDTIAPAPGLAKAPYLIGIATDGTLPPVGSSVFAHNVSLDDTLAASTKLQGVRAKVHHERAYYRQVAIDLDARVVEAESALADLRARYDAICLSTLWRLGAPLRRVARVFPRLARLVRLPLRAGVYALRGELQERFHAWRAAQPVPGECGLRRALGLPPAAQDVPAPASIRLPSSEAPMVTIIIPTYGQVDYTLRCLASIAAAPPAMPTEVLVVEDASGDPRIAELESIQGLRLVRWSANLGFLRSCNAAAKLARGQKLFFLNNDTEVMPGAVDALAALLDERPDAGLVGARLLYPDGFLQEAGGIIWRDGSAWNYGHGDDPRKSEYLYVRETDYISGAAIMLPRARWEEMEGFDEHYMPAYGEDADLAFRLRAAGWKVLYQPRATVIHHEGVSHGTDTASGIKANQVTNLRKLAERWGDTLAREALPPGERIIRARDRAAGRRITLVIDHYVPEPDRDAGSRSIMALMDAMLASGRILKFAPDNMGRTPVYAEALEARGIEVVHYPSIDSFRAWLARNGKEVDEVFVCRPDVAARHLQLLRTHTQAPIVFYGVDLHGARLRMVPGAMEDPEQRARIEAIEAMERNVWRLCDVVLYPSEEEAAYVRAQEPMTVARHIQAFSLPAPKLRLAPTAASGEMMFIGGFRHAPNVDAAIWLTQEILPLVQRQQPNARALIVGSYPPPEVLALAGPSVEVLGFVSEAELEALYDRIRVAICPLRIGAGVKLKVLEAMHRAVPVVTTPVGAQGLPGLREVCDVAGSAPDLAAAALRLMSNDALWMDRVAAQARYVDRHFSPASLRIAVENVFAAAHAAAQR